MARATLARQIGSAMVNATRNRASGGEGGGGGGSLWYTPHMAAASRAIIERIPLVDLVLEIRDARIPLSSKYELLGRNRKSSLRQIIVLNKMDLAERSQTKEWMSYFEQNNCISYGVNAHNKESIKQFLNFLQARVRELKKDNHTHTTTILLVGIPNVGKSALTNSLHQIGRISAAEKGKLKHAAVSPHPGETKDISSLKIGSHPNIYILDTPGVLPPNISDFEVFSKLALTGAISDSLVGGEKLAQYFLTILNLSEEYKKWSKLSQNEIVKPLGDDKAERSSVVKIDGKQRLQYPTDHTQVIMRWLVQYNPNFTPTYPWKGRATYWFNFHDSAPNTDNSFEAFHTTFMDHVQAFITDIMVNGVRKTLFETISSFYGNMNDERDMTGLVEAEIVALKEAFQISMDLNEKDARCKVAAKLLNLYRTGRLGHYTIDSIP